MPVWPALVNAVAGGNVMAADGRHRSGRTPMMRWAATPRILQGMTARQTWCGRLTRIGVNLLGAASAVLFARASIVFYLQSHRLIGAVFFLEQAWFVALFLIRRPPRVVTERSGAWLLAAGATSRTPPPPPPAPHPPPAPPPPPPPPPPA